MLALEDPRFPLDRMVQPDFRMTGGGLSDHAELVVRPSQGEMVVLPAWLCRHAPVHDGARDRVAIALNVLAVAVPEAGNQ